MDLKRLSSKAKELIERRGGTGSLKEDADELKRVAQGEESLTDKAKAAADALKEPGADQTTPNEAPAESPAADATPAQRERAAGKVEGEGRGKHGAGGRGRGRRQGKRRGGGGRGGGRGRDRL